MRRGAGVLAMILAVLGVAALLPPERSRASLTARSTSPRNAVAADSAANYLRLWSQGSDPARLTGYAVKRLSNPSVPTATGSDGTLALALGGWRNQSGTLARAFTIEARNPLPVGFIVVTASVVPGTATVGPATIAALGASGGSAIAVLTPGTKRQVNLTIPRAGSSNALLTATIVLTVQYAGYTGAFLAYRIPVTLWTGNGAGP